MVKKISNCGNLVAEIGERGNRVKLPKQEREKMVLCGD